MKKSLFAFGLLCGLLSGCATQFDSTKSNDAAFLAQAQRLSAARDCYEAESQIRKTSLSQSDQLLLLAGIADDCRKDRDFANQRLRSAALLGNLSAANELQRRGINPPRPTQAVREPSAASSLSVDDILRLQQIISNSSGGNRRGPSSTTAREQTSCTTNGWLVECSRGRQQLSCTRNGSLIQCNDGSSCQINGNLITCN